jgi:type IV pilus assembly protein PilM
MVDLHKEVKLSDFIPKGIQSKKSVKPVEGSKRKALPAQLVGLKIEAGSLTAAQVVNTGGMQLVRIARAPLPPGAVNAGEVRDPAALATALNELFDSNDLPRQGVRLGLANTRVGVRTIEVAGVTDSAQLENAVGFRAHEILSVPLEESVRDYHVLGSSVGEDGETTYRILLVMAFRDSVDRYLAATDAAGIDIAGIDLDAFALLRAALPPRTEPGPAETATVAVAIDQDLTTLAVSDGELCHFTRVLEWGTGDIDRALESGLRASAEQAQEVRSRLSLEGYAGSQPQPGAQQPEEIVARELRTLVRELLSSIRFYGSQPSALPIGGLVISGALTDIPGLAARVGSDLGLPVSVADPFARVELGPDAVRPEGSAGLAVAVGLGIED